MNKLDDLMMTNKSDLRQCNLKWNDFELPCLPLDRWPDWPLNFESHQLDQQDTRSESDFELSCLPLDRWPDWPLDIELKFDQQDTRSESDFELSCLPLDRWPDWPLNFESHQLD